METSKTWGLRFQEGRGKINKFRMKKEFTKKLRIQKSGKTCRYHKLTDIVNEMVTKTLHLTSI